MFIHMVQNLIFPNPPCDPLVTEVIQTGNSPDTVREMWPSQRSTDVPEPTQARFIGATLRAYPRNKCAWHATPRGQGKAMCDSTGAGFDVWV